MPDFEYQELLPLGADDTPYRLLTDDFVDTFEAGGHQFLRVDPAALSLLTSEAMFDIAHFLRSGHLAQLRAILDDPEAVFDMYQRDNLRYSQPRAAARPTRACCSKRPRRCSTRRRSPPG